MSSISNIINGFNYLLSFLIIRPVRRYRSVYSGELTVQIVNGHKVLDSRNANYSYGGLYKVFDRLFHKLNFTERNFQNVLILGLGAGSIVSLLRNKYKCSGHITGVEVDPLIISIAKNHFNLGSFTDVVVICKDASEFLAQNQERFDLIIIDVYINTDVPPQFESADFISLLFNSGTSGGMIIFNKLAYDEQTTASARKLIDEFKNRDHNLKVIQIKKNNAVNFMLVSTV